MQLQRFPVFIEFWARSLDFACDKVRIVDLRYGQQCLVLFVFAFACMCVCVFVRCCIFFCTDKTRRMSRSVEIGIPGNSPGSCDDMLTELRRERRPEGEFNCFWRDLT